MSLQYFLTQVERDKAMFMEKESTRANGKIKHYLILIDYQLHMNTHYWQQWHMTVNNTALRNQYWPVLTV